jgi:hypothetical protein
LDRESGKTPETTVFCGKKSDLQQSNRANTSNSSRQLAAAFRSVRITSNLIESSSALFDHAWIIDSTAVTAS